MQANTRSSRAVHARPARIVGGITDRRARALTTLLRLQQRRHVKRKTSMESELEAARRMLALRHFIPGRRFDVIESPAVDWLCQQDAVRQHVWNVCKAGLVLDIESGKWRGVDSTQSDE